jgi:hypothetical protein
MLCRVSTPLMRRNIDLNKAGNRLNLPVGVAVVPENVSQEHQHHMKAVLITQCSSPVYQCGNYVVLVG